MKSRSGFWASVVLVGSIPAALAVQMVFGAGAETVLHFAFAAGMALLAFAAFDFHTPRLVSFAGASVTALLALIFFLQGLNDLVPSETLHYLAFDVLGQRTERLLTNAMLLWLAAILFWDSEGGTRILGFVAVGGAFAVEAYNYWLNYHGTTLYAEFAVLKIVMLAPFIWLMIESTRYRR